MWRHHGAGTGMAPAGASLHPESLTWLHALLPGYASMNKSVNVVVCVASSPLRAEDAGSPRALQGRGTGCCRGPVCCSSRDAKAHPKAGRGICRQKPCLSCTRLLPGHRAIWAHSRCSINSVSGIMDTQKEASFLLGKSHSEFEIKCRIPGPEGPVGRHSPSSHSCINSPDHAPSTQHPQTDPRPPGTSSGRRLLPTHAPEHEPPVQNNHLLPAHTEPPLGRNVSS